MKQKQCGRTYIGGQAVIEGIMMRGKRAMATAVRDPQGEIQIESERLKSSKKVPAFTKWPIIRGCINFITSLIDGNRVLLRSADVAIPEEEQEEVNEKQQGLFNTLATLLGVGLALVIFIALPQWITGWLPFDKTSPGWEGVWFSLIEGGVRLLIFIGYILVISLIPSLRRVYMCHGAEHKTITCYEEGKELTVENVRGCSRVHDRCGTTFLFLTMIVSILVFSVANVLVVRWFYTGNATLDGVIRFAFKVLLLPLVAGVSYEVLKLLAKTTSKAFWILKAPGLLLQRLTTREPEDGMIECAIKAFEMVLKMDEDPTIPERAFALPGKLSQLLAQTKTRFENCGIEPEEAEWLFAIKLDMQKSAVTTEERYVKQAQVKEIFALVDERLTGRPLWYVVGDTDFWGYKIKVDERVLIPRPETEELAAMIVAAAKDGDEVLDLCTGSGAIAVAVKKETEKAGKQVRVEGVDISEGALAVAKENALANNAEITFIQSDLFANVNGKFDIIVSNPPYIPSEEIETLQREVKDYEPRLALDGGADGLDLYRRIADGAKAHVKAGGMLMMEVGAGEAQAVAAMFKDAQTEILKDFNGVERYVKIVL